MKDNSFKRGAGILMPVSSLPSPYGIGTFGEEAYRFVDFVAESQHGYWQVLPLGPTGYGDSPYQSYSAFAGNPYFIDLDVLVKKGYLLQSEPGNYDWGCDAEAVDYGLMYNNRFQILHQAYERFKEKLSTSRVRLAAGLPLYKQYDNFKEANSFWLHDYALFMSLKKHFDYRSWSEWDDDIKHHTPHGIAKYNETLEDETGFWEFVQFEFDNQWTELKNYANAKGVQIIGDIPLYMGYDSADVWSGAAECLLDDMLLPSKVAGVPPDAFSDAGQKWGNPLYDWARMEQNGYNWWRLRMEHSARLYDVIRIDHFIGIVKYYTIPADMPDARMGEYAEGPGQKLLDVINEAIGDKRIIAEDLGVALPEVDRILKDNHYPSMKVLEFAFGGDRKNPHLPIYYTPDCVVYGGTHDNETLLGFFENRGDWELEYAYEYLDTRDKYYMVDRVFREAYGSVASLVVFGVWDILKLNNQARMNTPSSFGNNWRWRMRNGALGEQQMNNLRFLASIYAR